MTVLTVLHYPDERLRTVAQAVPAVTAEIKQLVKDMLETMYDENGIGLAATQVNVHKRVVVIDIS
jgi:peptide deformylase